MGVQPGAYGNGREGPGNTVRDREKEHQMENMEITIVNNTLTITVDLSVELRPSKSRKNMIIAGTGGNQKIPGTDATIGLSIYKPFVEIMG